MTTNVWVEQVRRKIIIKFKLYVIVLYCIYILHSVLPTLYYILSVLKENLLYFYDNLTIQLFMYFYIKYSLCISILSVWKIDKTILSSEIGFLSFIFPFSIDCGIHFFFIVFYFQIKQFMDVMRISNRVPQLRLYIG